jgi:Fur family peroxide stress response transcriptional regulator
MAEASASDEDLVERFRDLCRAAGLRATPQRIEILKELSGHRGHPSAEEVHRALAERMPTVSLDTVYRALSLFESHGMLVKLWGPGGRCRFDPNREPHHHLVCDECGAIEDFTWPRFEELAPPDAASTWGRVSRVQVEVHGLCRSCARGQRGATDGG